MTDIIEVLRGFDDHMERVEPGYKARKAAEHARREAEAAEGRARLIAEYGSEEAVFARTDREQALWDAMAPHGRVEMSVGADGTEYPPYIAECLGVEHTYGGALRLEMLPPKLVDLVSEAYPIPATLAGVMDELRDWKQVERNRDLFWGEYYHHFEVQCRILVLENEMDTRPAATLDDLRARFDWWQQEIDSEGVAEAKISQKRKDTIVADVERLFLSKGAAA